MDSVHHKVTSGELGSILRRLRQLCEDRRTQESFAETAGLTARSLRRIESGLRLPRRRDLERDRQHHGSAPRRRGQDAPASRAAPGRSHGRRCGRARPARAYEEAARHRGDRRAAPLGVLQELMRDRQLPEALVVLAGEGPGVVDEDGTVAELAREEQEEQVQPRPQPLTQPRFHSHRLQARAVGPTHRQRRRPTTAHPVRATRA